MKWFSLRTKICSSMLTRPACYELQVLRVYTRVHGGRGSICLYIHVILSLVLRACRRQQFVTSWPIVYTSCAFEQRLAFALQKVGKGRLTHKEEQLSAIRSAYDQEDAFGWLLTGVWQVD